MDSKTARLVVGRFFQWVDKCNFSSSTLLAVMGDGKQQRAMRLPYITQWVIDALTAVIPFEIGRLLDIEGGIPPALSVSLTPYRMDAYVGEVTKEAERRKRLAEQETIAGEIAAFVTTLQRSTAQAKEGDEGEENNKDGDHPGPDPGGTATSPPVDPNPEEPLQLDEDEEVTVCTVSVGNANTSLVLTGLVNGKTTHMCADTGSAQSLMSEEMYKMLYADDPDFLQLKPVRTVFRSADGPLTQPRGFRRMHLQFGRHHFWHNVVVLPNWHDVFLLGLDFLRKHRWTKPHPDEDYFVLDGHKRLPFSVPPQVAGPSRGCLVLNAPKTKLRRKETWTVAARVAQEDRKRYNVGDTVMITPCNWVLSERRLVAANAVGRILPGHRVVVQFTNISNDKLNTIKRDINQVAFIQRIQPSNIVTQIIDHRDLDYVRPDGAMPALDLAAVAAQAGLPKEKEEELLTLLKRRERAFAVDPKSPLPNKVLKHTIETGKQQPIKVPPYRTSPAEDEAIEKEVQMMLDKGIIRPSHSPWSSPVVLVKKPDGSWRFCFDARRLNEVTKKDAYAVPRVQEMLSRFNGAKYFTAIDCASGFWQVPLDETSMEKTAFVTKFGLFEFIKMPFGITNAPSAFQRLMDQVLGHLRWTCAMCFIDDICVYSKTWEQHLRDVDAVLGAMENAGISAKLSKCQFAREEIRFLGYMVNRTGVRADPDKLTAVRDYPEPTSLMELRSVLGLFNYYRQLVRNFAHIAEPLTRLTKSKQEEEDEADEVGGGGSKKGKIKKGQIDTAAAKKGSNKPQPPKWMWQQEQQLAFDLLKDRLCSGVVLVHPDFTERFFLHTDCSGFAIGAVLAQVIEGKERAVSYWSKTLNAQQRRYSATEREGLAMYEAVRHFRPYLSHDEFTLVTDHAALRYLTTFKDPTHRINRWIMYLQDLRFKVEHRRGVNHGNADGLSRRPGPEPPPNPEEDEPVLDTEEWLTAIGVPLMENLRVSDGGEQQPCSKATVGFVQLVLSVGTQQAGEQHTSARLPPLVDVIGEQQKEPLLQAYVHALTHGLAGLPKEQQTLLVDLDNYQVVEGVLYHYLDRARRRKSPNFKGTGRLRLVVPQTLKRAVLTAYHDSILKGHQSVERTYRDLRERFYWVGMYGDVVAFIRSCRTCGYAKLPKRGASSGLTPIDPAEQLVRHGEAWHEHDLPAPFSMIGIDFVGPVTKTKKGNMYILTVTDYITRWSEAFPCKDMTAKTAADLLLERIFLQYRIPDICLSDQGPHFVNQLMDEVFTALEVRHVTASAYRPQTNGLVERFNQTLAGLLRLYANKYEQWDDLLPYVLYAYRTTYHEAVGNTPYYLLYGVEPVTPTDLVLLPQEVRDSLTEPDRHQALQRLHEARAAAREAMRKSQERSQQDTAHRRAPPPYKIGDLVMTYKPQGEGKFALPYSGPYRIDRFLHEGRTLSLVHVDTGEIRCSHIDNTKPFQQSKELRPEEAVPPEAAIPSEQQIDRTITHLDHTLRNAIRAVPLERLRPVLSSALGDEYRRVPELTRGMIQELEQMRPWQHPMVPPQERPLIEVDDLSSESENEEEMEDGIIEVEQRDTTVGAETETTREKETTAEQHTEANTSKETETKMKKAKEIETTQGEEKEEEKEEQEEGQQEKEKEKDAPTNEAPPSPSQSTQQEQQEEYRSSRGRKRKCVHYDKIQNKYNNRRRRR